MITWNEISSLTKEMFWALPLPLQGVVVLGAMCVFLWILLKFAPNCCIDDC